MDTLIKNQVGKILYKKIQTKDVFKDETCRMHVTYIHMALLKYLEHLGISFDGNATLYESDTRPNSKTISVCFHGTLGPIPIEVWGSNECDGLSIAANKAAFIYLGKDASQRYVSDILQDWDNNVSFFALKDNSSTLKGAYSFLLAHNNEMTRKLAGHILTQWEEYERDN